MKWENFNLHLEILLPGILTLFLLLILIPEETIAGFTNELVKNLLENVLVGSVVFLATSYMLGVITVVFSRLIVDRVSESLPRPRLLKLLSRGKLVGMTYKQINEEYRNKIGEVLGSENEEVRKEVIKRRETGRLVRTALVPLILTILVLNFEKSWWCNLLFVLGTFLIILLIYAYVEATLYEKCMLGADQSFWI